MSRIGKLPVQIPQDVEVKVSDGVIVVKGPLGTLEQEHNGLIKIEVKDNEVVLERSSENKKHRAFHGLYRSLINNMVIGVSKGYEKKLTIVGVGYRATKEGNKLNLQLGYSHPLVMEDPEGITVEVPNPNEIIVKGIDKQLVGNYAAKIRAWREPEPYKGKGVRYHDEYVRRKEGKSGK